MTIRNLVNVIGSVLVLACFGTSAFGSISNATVSLTLAWDPSADPSVAGYRLYQGSQSQTYTNVADIGNQTIATVSGMIPGRTYYFAVTAYDNSGLESAFSGELDYTPPTSTPQPPIWQVGISVSAGSSNQVMLSGEASVGTVYQVWATEDFVAWSVIGAITADATGSFQFTDPNTASPLQRFYRLVPGTARPASPGTTSGSQTPTVSQARSL